MTGWERLAEATSKAPSRYVLMLDVLLELGLSEETLAVAVRNVVHRRERIAAECADAVDELEERRTKLPAQRAAS